MTLVQWSHGYSRWSALIAFAIALLAAASCLSSPALAQVTVLNGDPIL